MNKPTSLIIEDLKKDIANTINGAGLPPFIIEYVLRDLLAEVSALARQAAQNEQAEYFKSLEEKEEEAPEQE